MKKVFVLLLSVAVGSFGLIGCKGEGKPKNGDDKPNATEKADSDHPEGDKADSDHPEGDHPAGDKADGDHPEGDHPEGEKKTE